VTCFHEQPIEPGKTTPVPPENLPPTPVVRPLPRLGVGVCWSDITDEIRREREEQK
jgi:hypothetical protein